MYVELSVYDTRQRSCFNVISLHYFEDVWSLLLIPVESSRSNYWSSEKSDIVLFAIFIAFLLIPKLIFYLFNLNDSLYIIEHFLFVSFSYWHSKRLCKSLSKRFFAPNYIVSACIMVANNIIDTFFPLLIFLLIIDIYFSVIQWKIEEFAAKKSKTFVQLKIWEIKDLWSSVMRTSEEILINDPRSSVMRAW